MTQASNTGGKRRWTTLLLIVSLALNLIIVGVIAGFALRGPKIGTPSAPSMPGAISLLRAVPDSHRGELRSAFKDQRTTLQSYRKEIDGLRDAFLAVISTDPLDVAKLEELLASHRAIESNISQSGQALLLKTITTMDLDARLELVEKAKKMPRRPPRGKDKRP